MKIKLPVIAMVLAALVTGCASVPMASVEADSAAKVYKTEPGKANVYIYRNEAMGSAVKLPVLIDDRAVGDTVAKTYILKQVEPGDHIITSKSETDSKLALSAVAGSNYFIWQEVKMGMWAAGSELHLVDEAIGKAGVAECKLIQ
jgi:Protein of unknown function (DUF2846)